MFKLPGYDHCLLGIAESPDGIFRLAYSSEMIVDSLCEENDWDHELAQEYFDMHFLDCEGSPDAPVFVTQMDMDLIEDMLEESRRDFRH